jgi:hypothetical protein
MGDGHAARKMATGMPAQRHERLIALMLVVCVVAVGFWEIVARRSGRAFQPFGLTACDFYGFVPASTSWSVRPLPVGPDPIEPNIAAYELRDRTAESRKVHDEKTEVSNMESLLSGSEVKTDQVTSEGGGFHVSSFTSQVSGFPLAPIFVRLVHGYNMPDCMRIKGYKVELIADRRQRAEDRGQKAEDSHSSGFRSQHSSFSSAIQVWRLTSSIGDTAIWITGMLKAGDFSETDVDVRSMAFPHIGIPDDPGWLPHGVTMKSLSHPIRNFRLLLRAKWNNARCNLATFLRLKQPAWADEELLTLVVASPFVAINGGENSDSTGDGNVSVVAREIEAYGFMLNELQKWRGNLNNAGFRNGEPPMARGGK